MTVLRNVGDPKPIAPNITNITVTMDNMALESARIVCERVSSTEYSVPGTRQIVNKVLWLVTVNGVVAHDLTFNPNTRRIVFNSASIPEDAVVVLHCVVAGS